jgi:hypothetical protein
MTVISGQVRGHAGQGVPGVFVAATPVGGRRFTVMPSTHTDRDGWWRLELVPGQWHVRETGFGSHDLLVANDPIDTTPEALAMTPTQVTHQDVNELIARRRGSRTAEEPSPAESDIAALLARRRQRRSEG